MVWSSDNRTGVSREIATMLKRLEGTGRQSNGQNAQWLDIGQRATIAALRERLCLEDSPGAIIADEVGMGKTRIAVAMAMAVHRAKRGDSNESGRSVIVVPPGLLHQWRREFQNAMLAAGVDPPDIPQITSFRDLFDTKLTKAPIILLPHGLLNFQMKNGWASRNLRDLYARRIHGYSNFSRLIHQDEKIHIRAHVAKLARGEVLGATDLQSGNPGREAFISYAISLLGTFDLLIIDEAHKSKGADTLSQDVASRSTLAQLLTRLVRPQPKRLCLTATPFELDAYNWRQILERCGVSCPETLAGVVKASEAFAAAAHAVRLIPSLDNAQKFKAASETFEAILSPWLFRRRKAVKGDDSVLERYIRDHGVHYRDRSEKILAQVTGADWPRATLAVEALSLMPATGLRGQKRLRLALARNFSIEASVASAQDSSEEDMNEIAKFNAPQPQAEDTPAVDQTIKRREARAKFWLDRLTPLAAEPYSHPTLLATVHAVEKITALSDSPEKVLIFGIFTRAMEQLTDLLNAREMIRRLTAFRDTPELSFKSWHWPAETMPKDADFQCALTAACRMEDIKERLGEAGIAELPILLRQQYAKYQLLRAKILSEVKSFITQSVEPQLGFSSEENLTLPLAQALIEIMDEHQSRGGAISHQNAWEEFLSHNLPQHEENDGEAENNRIALIKIALEDHKGRDGGFARRLAGGMHSSSKQHLQNAFNRRSSWPMVLVTQSLVGREGLNLHKSCRTVILFQPEWNPGIVEQQIGRVDRLGSLWEEMVQRGNSLDRPPKIRVIPVEFPGTYDEHNWQVLNERWDSYRAQMNGEIFTPGQLSDQGLEEVMKIVTEATPSFSPLDRAEREERRNGRS